MKFDEAVRLLWIALVLAFAAGFLAFAAGFLWGFFSGGAK